MIQFLFALSLLLVLYIYFGYPAVVFLLSLLNGRQVKKQTFQANVSVLISAFNEEKHIEDTVRNKLEQNYGNGELEVIVVSDESTDRTDEIVKSIEDERVSLLRQVPRQGKSSALNMAINHAKGDIIVFSDANSLYAPGALEKLVNNFSDPSVGYVTGKMIYSNPDGSVVGDGCDTYMRYENFIRTHESRINSVVGVDGGIDAIRRELFQPLNADQLPDFVQPLRVVEQGYRVVYEPEAVLKEDALTDQDSEYRMRVRVCLRALWALYDMRCLLNPSKFSLFSWQLWSHKVLRYGAWLPILFVFLFNLLLLGSVPAYWIIFIFQCVFYICAISGWHRRDDADLPSCLSVPYYFSLTNIASAHACMRFLRKEKTILWNPRTG